MTYFVGLILAFSVALIESKCFGPSITCNKKNGCAFDKPTEVLKDIENKVICSYTCASRNYCVSFNYKESVRECLLFDIYPYKLDTIDDCTGYDISPVPGMERKQGENLAKYRRACQSTILVGNHGNWRWPWLETDGLYGTSVSKGECAQTDQTDSYNNWFMVDLLQYAKISYVRIRSAVSVGIYAIRYKDLVVGVTNHSSLIGTPQRGDYPLCGICTGPAPNSTWFTVSCQPSIPSARFVIVHQTPTNTSYGGFMALCEVEVYN